MKFRTLSPRFLRTPASQRCRWHATTRVANACVIDSRASTNVPSLLQFSPFARSQSQCRAQQANGAQVVTEAQEQNNEFRLVCGEAQKSRRLDAAVAALLSGGASRARVQESIKGGLVSVNGKVQKKPSSSVQLHDVITGSLTPRPPMEAVPEEIEGALDVIFEDEHVLVLNKPAHLVVHPAVGNTSGTLVNALLHHMGAPRHLRERQLIEGKVDRPYQAQRPNEVGEEETDTWVRSKEGDFVLYGDDDDSDDEDMDHDLVMEEKGNVDTDRSLTRVSPGAWSVKEGAALDAIRPGIVHRLDKGTSGLLVVAKDPFTEASLCAQFKARTTQRTYLAILCGMPSIRQAVIDAPIGRDPRDRKRMAVLFPSSRQRSRRAVSRYEVLKEFYGGAASLVKWQLGTGRTHQIRVHAKHIGHPILGDSTYGGSGTGALQRIVTVSPADRRQAVGDTLRQLDRPCLHAATLGFVHPHTSEQMQFSVDPPEDFQAIDRLLSGN